MAGEVDGRTVLVTGGTGSFGQTMARHLLERGAAQVRVFSRDEAKQDAMRHDIADPRLRLYLGDVRDLQSVERATLDVDFVFHAAALKQVPLVRVLSDRGSTNERPGQRQRRRGVRTQRGVIARVLKHRQGGVPG